MKLMSCTEWLFFHLWKANPETGTSCPGVCIPDTVLYRWAKPHFYYYTNEHGVLARRTKERIFTEELRETFAQDASK